MSVSKKTQDLILDISLTDVIYGVIFAYGFNYFDSIKNSYGYFFFLFTYAILIVDWVYTHHTYWGKDYKKAYLILDLTVLFIFSRLLKTSANSEVLFFYWLSLLFVGYALWDAIMRLNKIEHGYNWILAFGGDIFAAVIFTLLGILASLKIISTESIWATTALIVVYCLTISTWFAKGKQEKIAA